MLPKQEVILNTKHKDRLSELVALTRTSTSYTDVNFLVEGQSLPCHKIILASACEYFHELFQGKYKDCSEIPISNMTYASLNSIREFIYTGKIEVNIKNIFDLLEIAIDIGYCDLQHALSDYSAPNFQNILASKKFLKMSAAAIKIVFAHKDLKESSESLICSHLLRWLEHDPEERYQSINQLLLSLRLHCLSPEFIQYTLLTHPHVVRNKDAIEKLQSMLRHILFNDSVPPFVESHFPRTQTDVCDGLAVIHMHQIHKITYFGLDSSGHITEARSQLNTLNESIDLIDAQTCVLHNTVYITTKSNKFVKIDMSTLLAYTCSIYFTSKNFIMAAGKMDELVLFAGTDMKRYQFLSNTWTKLATTPLKPEGETAAVISFERSQSSGSDWYLLDNSSTAEKTCGALIDNGMLYIFGAKPRNPAMGVSSQAVNILRIQASTEDVQLLEMVLPEPVKRMHVLSYKEHVILVGTNKVYIIKLEDLRMSKTMDTTPDVGQRGQLETGKKADVEHDNETGKIKEFEQPVQSSAQVITSKLSDRISDTSTVFKLCRIGNQLIKFEGIIKYDWTHYPTEAWKYNTFLSADVEDVIQNTEGVHWKKIGELREMKDTYEAGNFVMVPLKFIKENK